MNSIKSYQSHQYQKGQMLLLSLASFAQLIHDDDLWVFLS